MLQTYPQVLSIENFNELSQEILHYYRCPLCLGILFNPIMDECNHFFCESCFYIYLKNFTVCPFFQKPYESLLPKKMSCIGKIIGQLVTKCPNFSLGCNWINKVNFIPNHLLTDCVQKYISCHNKECKEELTLSNVQEHYSVCTFTTKAPPFSPKGTKYRPMLYIFDSEGKIVKLENNNNAKPPSIDPVKKETTINEEVIIEEQKNKKENVPINYSIDKVSFSIITKEENSLEKIILTTNSIQDNQSIVEENQSHEIPQSIQEETEIVILEENDNGDSSSDYESLIIKHEEKNHYKNDTVKAIISAIGKKLNNETKKENCSDIICFPCIMKECSYVIGDFEIKNNQESDYVYWKVIIKKMTGWMNFGVYDQKEVLQKHNIFNQECDCFIHGSYCFSSDGYYWGNQKELRPIQDQQFPQLSAGDTILFRYSLLSEQLSYKINNYSGLLGQFSINNQSSFFPCAVLSIKTDQVSIEKS